MSGGVIAFAQSCLRGGVRGCVSGGVRVCAWGCKGV